MTDKQKLTQSEIKSKLNYDLDSGIFTWIISNKNGTNAGDIAGCVNPYGYVMININNKQYRAHRLAWIYVYGTWPAVYIDHINGIKSDNRIVNLREANLSQNQHNQRKAQRHNSSGLLGITWDKKLMKWKAIIKINSKSVHIGLFDDKHEAHQAYLNKKREVHKFCTI